LVQQLQPPQKSDTNLEEAMMKTRFTASMWPALVLMAWLSAAALAAEAAPLPETPAGVRMAEIVDLFNQGDKAAAAEYVEQQYTPGFRDAFPAAQHAGIFQQVHGMYPGLAPAEVLESSDTACKALMHSEGPDLWLELYLEVEPSAPNRIASIGVRPVRGPAGRGGGAAEEPRFTSLSDLGPYLAGAERAGTFSGVVLVARDGTPVFHEAYGFACKGHGVANRPDTKFNLGSINKIFTSVAAAQLMQQGRLGLYDPIGKYLDIYPEEVAARVTIKHLLDMSSGWGDYWGNETYLANRFDLRTVSDYMEFLKDMPLGFEPGSRTAHSNTGFEVLGATIEAITGQDYFDYVRENIYMPAGMTASDSYERDAVVENMATGYTNLHPYDELGEGFSRSNTLMLSPRGTPAGGGYSTAGDLLKFAQALGNNKLLNAEYTGLLMNGFQEPEEGREPSRRVGYAGGAPGVSAFLGIDLESGYTIIVLSNYDSPVAMEIGRAIRDALPGSE
jgi:D-alanyl-D-alanine carboxypeptidase